MIIKIKLKAAKFVIEKTVDNQIFYPSTAPKSTIKHQQFISSRIYPPSVSNHPYTLIYTLSKPVSTLQRGLTIKNFFVLMPSMDQLTVENVQSEKHPKENKIYCMLYRN